MTTPLPAYSSGAACRRLDESRRKIGVLVAVGALDLVANQVTVMTRTVAYLRANFPAAALTRGPVQ